MKLVYIAGAYRARTISEVFDNIMIARKAAIDLWQKGFVVICPHLNSFLMDGDVDDDTFLKGDIEILKRCDAIFMIKNFKRSLGAIKELEKAKELGLEIIYE